MPVSAHVFAVERRKEPALDLRPVAQLMPLRGPEIEGLLRKIAGLTRTSRQAQGKAIERGVVSIDELFEVIHRRSGNRRP
jgi:hypothetical protein